MSEEIPTVVLVHGAFADASSWNGVVELLQAKGLTVTAPANQSANEGASTSFNLGSFTDVNGDSPWLVDVDWGDGSTHTTLSRTSTGTIPAQSHTYADGPATRTVTVTTSPSATRARP